MKSISYNERYRNRPFAQPTRRPVRNRRSGRPLCGTLGNENHQQGKKGERGRKFIGFPVAYVLFDSKGIFRFGIPLILMPDFS